MKSAENLSFRGQNLVIGFFLKLLSFLVPLTQFLKLVCSFKIVMLVCKLLNLYFNLSTHHSLVVCSICQAFQINKMFNQSELSFQGVIKCINMLN